MRSTGAPFAGFRASTSARTHSAPARVLPAPRPPSISQVVQSPSRRKLVGARPGPPSARGMPCCFSARPVLRGRSLQPPIPFAKSVEPSIESRRRARRDRRGSRVRHRASSSRGLFAVLVRCRSHPDLLGAAELRQRPRIRIRHALLGETLLQHRDPDDDQLVELQFENVGADRLAVGNLCRRCDRETRGPSFRDPPRTQVMHRKPEALADRRHGLVRQFVGAADLIPVHGGEPRRPLLRRPLPRRLRALREEGSARRVRDRFDVLHANVPESKTAPRRRLAAAHLRPCLEDAERAHARQGFFSYRLRRPTRFVLSVWKYRIIPASRPARKSFSVQAGAISTAFPGITRRYPDRRRRILIVATRDRAPQTAPPWRRPAAF